MPKQNAFLAKLKAQAAAKESVRSDAHVEMDTIALLFLVHDKFKVGPGRASDVMNDFLLWKLDIAETILKELDEDQSKKKELVLTPRDIAARLKEILGKDGWEKYHIHFPFVRGKAKMYGMKTTFIPNSKADQRRKKPFVHKKGKKK